jgi:hypothetical protein
MKNATANIVLPMLILAFMLPAFPIICYGCKIPCLVGTLRVNIRQDLLPKKQNLFAFLPHSPQSLDGLFHEPVPKFHSQLLARRRHQL